MSRLALVLVIPTLALLSACGAPEGNPETDTRAAAARALTSSGAAMRDIAAAGRIGATNARDTAVETAEAARQRAEILAMPQIQPGWIEPSDATVQAAAAPANWDYDQQRAWRVRLKNGKIYTVVQAGRPLKVGQEVSLVRYGANLAITAR